MVDLLEALSPLLVLTDEQHYLEKKFYIRLSRFFRQSLEAVYRCSVLKRLPFDD